MTISSPTFQRLQDGIKSVDDLRVRGPINAALGWLSGDLVTQLNARFNSISNSLSQINSSLAAISQSVSVQISVHLSNRPTFSANKNNVSQTSISTAATPITFGTEAWDVGGHFSASTWTPPAGNYRLSAALSFTTLNAVDNEGLAIQVFRDGAVIRDFVVNRAGTGAQPVSISILVNANGSNAYDIRGRKLGAGIGTVDGSTAQTWFEGEAV